MVNAIGGKEGEGVLCLELGCVRFGERSMEDGSCSTNE